jgi:hypothetical protein
MLVDVVLNGSELRKGDVVIIPSTNTIKGEFIKADKEWAYFNILNRPGWDNIKSSDINEHFYVVDPISYIKNRL